MKSENYTGIQNELARIIRGTEWEGHVYLVGGCVRDEIMGDKIHDVDIAVDLPNGGIRFACWLGKNRHTAKGQRIILFEHFGTAKFRLKMYPKDEIDCVQTRKERYEYEEKPDLKKYFGTIEQDALCRDITINTLFRNLSTGALLDPTGKGLSDIENHIIRTPNDPDISLRDNAMHILRCIRFAAKYDWRISNELIDSMRRNVDIVATATPHRMTNEAIALLRLKRKKRAFGLISKVGAMPFLEPYLLKLQQTGDERKKQKDKPRERKRRRRKGEAG